MLVTRTAKVSKSKSISQPTQSWNTISITILHIKPLPSLYSSLRLPSYIGSVYQKTGTIRTITLAATLPF